MKTPLLLLLLLTLLRIPAARACSCVEERISERKKIVKAYKQDALIFTGRVVSAETVFSIDTLRTRSRLTGVDSVYGYQRREMRRYTFAVSRLLKGPASSSTVLVSAETHSSCGRSFKVGTEYLIHASVVSEEGTPDGRAHRVPPYFLSDLCTRTKPLGYARRAELRQLARLAARG